MNLILKIVCAKLLICNNRFKILARLIKMILHLMYLNLKKKLEINNIKIFQKQKISIR